MPILIAFWNTTDMQVGEEREVLVRTSLRELGIYLAFLAILCIGELIKKRLFKSNLN